MFNQDPRAVIAAYLQGKLQNAVYSAVVAITRILLPHANPRTLADSIAVQSEIDALVNAIVRQLEGN